jgi:hypothetical protein
VGDDDNRVDTSGATINKLRIEEGLDKLIEDAKKEDEQTQKDRPQSELQSKFYEIWSEIIKLPTIGPYHAY